MATKVKPRKAPDDLKSNLVRLRLTEADKAEIGRLAAAEGVSMSEYIRRHLLRERGSINRPKAEA